MSAGRRKPAPRWPTGELTVSNSVRFDAGKAKLVQEVAKLPENKDLTETLIMEAFAGSRELNIPMPTFEEFKRPATDQATPDFELLSGGNVVAFAELVKIAPLGPGGYNAAPEGMFVADYIDFAARQVAAKQAKYAARDFNPLYLLMFATDERFVPAGSILEALAQTIKGGNHSAFERIYFIVLRPHNALVTISSLTDYPGTLKAKRIRLIRGKKIHAKPPRIVADNSRPDWVDVTVRYPVPTGESLSSFRRRILKKD